MLLSATVVGSPYSSLEINVSQATGCQRFIADLVLLTVLLEFLMVLLVFQVSMIQALNCHL